MKKSEKGRFNKMCEEKDEHKLRNNILAKRRGK